MENHDTGSDRERGGRRKRVAKMTDLSTVGLVFPVAMIIGYFAGRAIGALFGAAEGGGMIGGALGLVAGFYNVYKTAVELERQERDAASEDIDGDG